MPASIRLEVESPKGRQTIVVPHGQRHRKLTELLRKKDLPLNTRCGQRGLCDGCMVELIAGTLVHSGSGTQVSAADKPVPLHGCEHRLGEGGACIRIPPRSLLAYEPQVVSEFRINVPRAHDPLWQRLEVAREEIPAGKALADEICHVIARRYDRRRPVRLDLHASEQVRQFAQSAKFFVTIECRGDQWLITEVAGDPKPPGLGVAVDVGTTTVAILLVDLGDGRIVARAAGFNKQMHLGDDVLTRINLCMTDPAMLRQLQEEVVNQTIHPLVEEALSAAGASPERVGCFVMAGNTTMLHLLAGVDPTPMGTAPFTPVFLEHRVMPSDAVHLKALTGKPPTVPVAPSPSPAPVPDDPTIHLLPSAAAYVGADLTGGIFSSGLIYDEGPSLLVDVGTNGEIILKHGDKLLGCATAAGPAFEGAGLANGVRAGDGALSHIWLDESPFKVRTEVIGGGRPIGLCGTAYVDFMAQARKIGLLNRSGRFEREAAPEAAAHLVESEDVGRAFRVALADGKREIVISELDIARLLQAKAAIAAGILTLLHRVGLRPDQVKTLYLAGGFGMHMNVGNAIGCGLFPGFRLDQVHLVGNTSLAGAYLALLDSGVLEQLNLISKRIEVIELNLDPGFEDRFIDQLSLPE
ncbi:MAG: DUF4445 domain-containing protein [Verrucomicrobia bacterium]|nr:DUF4445 domain-containing protein [Verrucomicrobiota bacterium]